MTQIEIVKNRSIGACLRDAYTWFTANLKGVFKRDWWLVLLVSFFFALYLYSSMTLNPDAGNLSASELVGQSGLLMLGLVGCLVFGFWLSGRWLGLFNGQPTGYNVKRFIKFFLMYLLFVIVWVIVGILVMFAFMGTDNIGNMRGCGLPSNMLSGIMALLFIMLLMLIALVPLVYSGYKYLLNPDQCVGAIFGKPYRRGWRHWGFIFGAALLSYLIYYIIYIIAFIPSFVVMFASKMNMDSVSMGDASSMPGSFPFLTILAMTIGSFIIIFAMLWLMVTFVNIYGSVEARENPTTLPVEQEQ